MDDAGEGSRATRRQVLGATAGALAVGALPGRGAAQADGGDLIWEFEIGSYVDLAGPTVVSDTVYFGGDDDKVYAVDAQTGTEQWRFDTGGSVNSAPFVTDGTLYVGTGHWETPEATNVYAIDVATETVQWKFETDDAVRSSPTVVDGTVFVGSNDNNVYALDADTGAEQWRFETDNPIQWSSPTVVDGLVFIAGGKNDNVYALDATTGDEKWIFQTFSGWNYSSPTFSDGTIYVGSNDGNVYALDANDGTEKWSYGTGNWVQSSPTVSDNTVYIGANDSSEESGTYYALDAESGDYQWRFDTDGHAYPSPTVAGEKVFVASGDNNVYALDAASGDELWRFETGDEVWSSPIVSQGTVYVGSNDGNVYALDAGVPGSSVGSRVRLGTRGHLDERADRVTTVAPASFEVTVEDATEPPAGETLDVTVAIENTGEQSGTQTVSLTVDDVGSDSATVSLAGGDATTETLSLQTSEGDADEYTATVSTDDDSAQQEVTVLEPAAFTADIEETTTPVEGGTLDVTVAVENTGDTDGTRTVALSVPGLGSDSAEVSLDGGDSATETLSILTGTGDAGDYDATVEAGDSSDSTEVTVLAPAAFTVDITDTNNPVAGDPLEVTVAVENTGNEAGSQTVELSAPGLGSDSVEVDELDGGESTTETLSLSTGEGDAGEYTVTVDSGDDSNTRDATVLAPAAFTVEVTEVTEPVAGDPLEVTVDVENTGDDAGDQTVELSVPDLGSDSTTVSLDGDDATTETLSLSTADGDAGEYTATAESEDDSTQQTVAVLAPAAFTVTITDVSAPVAGEPLNVAVSVENTGDDAGDQTVELTAPGLGSNSTTVSLGGGESTSETLSLSTGEGDAGEYTVTAQTDDDEATATATVSEPAGDGDTGSPSDGTGAGGDDGNTPDDSTSGDDSTDPTDDGDSTGDGGLGTTEMAAVGGGGSLALLLGAYALMRRSDDDSDSPSEPTPDASTGGESPGQSSPSPSPSPGPDRGATRQRGGSDAGGVPSRIPDTPRPSLSYEDITVGDPLGRGGNADVYYATAATREGDVELAVKEPRMGGGETLHTEVVERMMQEAETWEQLDDHDHVAGVVDYGAEPLPWIAMEYMDGGHLGERAGEIGTAQKLWTALSVTEGVYHAHSRGIAHRDLKPENILFRRVDGAWDVPKVADWGLSKHLLEHSKSRDGMTVEYAAPEQFSDSASTDKRTDIYQLGAVFYELFTGQPPFEGEMFAVMEQIKTETPTPPSATADVPGGLDEILLRALAKEPDDRYSDIVYLRDDLQELFDQP